MIFFLFEQQQQQSRLSNWKEKDFTENYFFKIVVCLINCKIDLKSKNVIFSKNKKNYILFLRFMFISTENWGESQPDTVAAKRAAGVVEVYATDGGVDDD